MDKMTKKQINKELTIRISFAESGLCESWGYSK